MKRLHLLRHAKSDWSDRSLSDHDRPLNRRGKRTRKVIAGTSQAARSIWCGARPRCAPGQAQKPVIDALGCAVRHERALYTAGGREALESVRALPNDVDTVMLIGHNPSAGGVDGNVVRVVTPVSDGRARHDRVHDRSLGARRAGIRHAWRARHPRAVAGRR